MDLWKKCTLTIEELNEIHKEGYSSYISDSNDDVIERNPYPDNTLEYEFFSDGWEDAQEDSNQ